MFKEQRNHLKEKDKATKENEKLLKAKDSIIRNQDITLREKNQEIQRTKAALEKLSVERLKRFKVLVLPFHSTFSIAFDCLFDHCSVVVCAGS